MPEAKVLDLRYPSKGENDIWQSSIEALVTSGPLRDREIQIFIRSDRNRAACFLVPFLWIHSTIAAYNLAPAGSDAFEALPESFIVLEPLRQVNATAVARSLHCTKPQLDQIRRGKGDVTVQTLKGQLVHALFDRMLEGGITTSDDFETAYREVLPSFLLPLASVTDQFFDETAFRADVFRHLEALKGFIDCHPHLLEHTQLELKRYSATIGIQGRIDAIFREGNRLDILELKTGTRLRSEDHAQLFIYRLLLSDLIRRWQRNDQQDVEITTRLLSSIDGSFAPLRVATDFYQVLDTRNRLIAMQYALGRNRAHIVPRYEGFNEEICGNCASWTRDRCKDSSDVFGDRPASRENERDSAELEYFRRFTRLVERERWCADQNVADLLDDSRLEFRVKNFRTICGARIVAAVEPFTFEFEENTSDLECGDSVLIHAGRISSSATYHGLVREIGTKQIRLSIPLKNLLPTVFEDQSWIIDRLPSDVTAEASHTALYDFLVGPMDEKKKAVLEFPSSQRRGGATAEGWTERFAERTTPSAPPARWQSAQPPLLSKEGNSHRSTPANRRPSAAPRIATCFTSSGVRLEPAKRASFRKSSSAPAAVSCLAPSQTQPWTKCLGRFSITIRQRVFFVWAGLRTHRSLWRRFPAIPQISSPTIWRKSTATSVPSETPFNKPASSPPPRTAPRRFPTFGRAHSKWPSLMKPGNSRSRSPSDSFFVRAASSSLETTANFHLSFVFANLGNRCSSG